MDGRVVDDKSGDAVVNNSGTADPVFGNLDWNDNTPILQPILQSSDNVISFSMANNSTNLSPTKLINASATTPSPIHPMPGILYSPEDTLNNDFFYDDEFTVPFDANLGDGRLRLSSSLVDDEGDDIRNFLSLSKDYQDDEDVLDGDDNNEWHMPKMVVSKSDSCLYQADVELSGSEQNMSQELSGSDKDCASSSEMSDFRAEPLFSPLPQTNSAILQDDEEKLSASKQIELTELTESTGNQYNYDWRASANKNQYMISFDKICGKQYSSDESSFHESLRVSGTGGNQWHHKSYTSQVSWGSIASKNATGSSGHEDDDDDDVDEDGDVITHRFCSLSQPDAQELTTWQRLKQKATHTHVTWASLKKAHKEGKKEAAAATVRSKSMHELGDKDKEIQADTDEDVIDGLIPPRSDSSQDTTSSKTLMELFNRMRSHSSGESLGIGLDCNEAMISPTSLQRLTGTWSMSTISSTQSHHQAHQAAAADQCAPTLPAGVTSIPPAIPDASSNGLVSWNTFQNLHSDRLVKVDMVDSITSSAGRRGNVGQSSTNTDSCQMNTVAQFDMANFAAQVGSGILTESRIYGKRKGVVENGTQYSFYANVKDCGIQTSWNLTNHDAFVKKLHAKSRRVATVALQTSFDKKPRPETHEMATSVILIKTAHDRLTSSFSGGPLPDLSFLGKVTCVTKRAKSLPPSKTKSHQSQQQAITQNQPDQPTKTKTRKGTLKCPNRRHSGSSDSSSSGGAPPSRGNRNSINVITNASFCSSSSSGIDPGSSTGDSQNHLHRMSDLADWSDSNSEGAPVEKTLKKLPQSRIHVHKMVGKVCSQCNGKNQADPAMSTSHPLSKNKKKKDAEFKSLEYLQVSPTHPPKSSLPTLKNGASSPTKRPKSMIPVMNSSNAAAKPKSRLPILGKKQQQQLFTCSRSQSQPDSLDSQEEGGKLSKLPLKSCLVKTRNNQRDRRIVMMKHRSWSDPRDALVMKHSQEGQVRYQLIHDKKNEKTKLDKTIKCPSAVSKTNAYIPQKEEHTNIAFHLSETLSKVKLDPVPEPPEAETETETKVIVKPKKVPPPPPPKPPRHLIHDPKQPEKSETVIMRPKPTVESPEQQIPLPNCGCLLQSSSTDSAGSGDSMSRAKKSVSFCERVSYHSPYSSPHASPKKAHVAVPGSAEGTRKEQDVAGAAAAASSESKETASTTAAASTNVPIPVPTAENQSLAPLSINTESCCSTSSSTCSDVPPSDFHVSPPHSPVPDSPENLAEALMWEQKRELVVRVLHSVEIIVNFFQECKDATAAQEKAKQDGSSSNSSETTTTSTEVAQTEVARLVVQQLSPALYALLADGLNPYTHSFFGRVKNNVWSVVELIAKQGSSTMLICRFVRDLKKMRYLNTPFLKFNAFIFCLLNHQALELWVMSLPGHRFEMSKHYATTSFVRLSLSSSVGKKLWSDLSTALQPLAQLQFRLDYAAKDMIIAAIPESMDTQGSNLSSGSSSVTQSTTNSPCKSRSMDCVRIETEGGTQDEVPARGVSHSFSEQILMRTSTKTKDFVKERIRSFQGMKPTTTSKESLNLKNGGSMEKTVRATQEYLANASAVLLRNVLHAKRNDAAIGWRRSASASSETTTATEGSTKPHRLLVTKEKSKSLDSGSSMQGRRRSNCDSARIHASDASDDSHSVSSSTECAPTLYSLSSLRSDSSNSSMEYSTHRERGSTNLKKSRLRTTISSFGPALIKLFDNVLLDTKSKEKRDQSEEERKEKSTIAMSQSVPVKLCEGGRGTAEEEQRVRGTAQIILDGDSEAVRRRPGAAALRRRRDEITHEQQTRSVTALCSYSSMDGQELSFEKGSTLTVLEEVDSEWLRCRLANRHGLVHKACVM